MFARIRQFHRHLWILLVVTLVTRGVLFISYPMGGFDDNQSAQRFLIDELLRGELHIGNLRYNTGYPLFIAPFVAVTRLFGRFDDRVLLLFQIALASLIPFLLYDMIRAWRNRREALLVALIAALDVFGLQWAHFALPVWMAATGLIAGMWLVHRARLSDRHQLAWVIGAGLVFGLVMLARLNLAPVIALIGVAFFWHKSATLKQRTLLFAALGITSGLVLGAYLVAIQRPSTGRWSMSCLLGMNLVQSAIEKEMTLRPDNGAATAEYADLLALPPLEPLEFTAALYPRWREPGAWATADEQAAFLAQTPQNRPDEIRTDFPTTLIYYIGQCETDALLRRVHNEALAKYPGRWLTGVVDALARMLVQAPVDEFDRWQLPRDDTLTYSGGNLLGFRTAQSDYYDGQVVWRPGIRIVPTLFDAFNILKWLTPLALLWALWRRAWVYTLPAVMLLIFLLTSAVVDSVEPRTSYAPVYPLYAWLIGGFIAALWARLQTR